MYIKHDNITVLYWNYYTINRQKSIKSNVRLIGDYTIIGDRNGLANSFSKILLNFALNHLFSIYERLVRISIQDRKLFQIMFNLYWTWYYFLFSKQVINGWKSSSPIQRQNINCNILNRSRLQFLITWKQMINTFFTIVNKK